MSGDTTLYEVLEVQPNAIESEIRTSYEILMQENCNDDTILLSWKDQKFQELTFAFEVLTDPLRRSQYDSYGLSAVVEMELNLEYTARDYSETECPSATPEFPYFFEKDEIPAFTSSLKQTSSQKGLTMSAECSRMDIKGGSIQDEMIDVPRTIDDCENLFLQCLGEQNKEKKKRQERLLHFINEAATLNRHPFNTNIMLIGDAGVGKSSTINHLMNSEMITTSNRAAATKTVTEYSRSCNVKELGLKGLKLNIIDTPGFADPDGVQQDACNLWAIQKFCQTYMHTAKILANPNIILFCVKASENRFDGRKSSFVKCLEILQAMRIIDTTNVNIVIVLTNACAVAQKKEIWMKEISETSRNMVQVLRERLGFSAKVVYVENCPEKFDLVRDDDATFLPDGIAQPENLYLTIMDQLKENGDVLGYSTLRQIYSDGWRKQRFLPGNSVPAKIVNNKGSISELDKDENQCFVILQDVAETSMAFQNLREEFDKLHEANLRSKRLQAEQEQMMKNLIEAMTSQLDQVLEENRESKKLYRELTQNMERMMRESAERDNASVAAKLQNEEIVKVCMHQVESSEKRLERMEEDMRKRQESWHDDMLRREKTFEERWRYQEERENKKLRDDETSRDEIRKLQKRMSADYKSCQDAYYEDMARKNAALENERKRYQDEMRETKLREEASRRETQELQERMRKMELQIVPVRQSSEEHLERMEENMRKHQEAWDDAMRRRIYRIFEDLHHGITTERNFEEERRRYQDEMKLREEGYRRETQEMQERMRKMELQVVPVRPRTPSTSPERPTNRRDTTKKKSTWFGRTGQKIFDTAKNLARSGLFRFAENVAPAPLRQVLRAIDN